MTRERSSSATISRKPSGVKLTRSKSIVDHPPGRPVKAKDGETLCSIAWGAGYDNCDELRKSSRNQRLNENGKNWQIVKGDWVFIPEGGSGRRQEAQVKVRFVRDSATGGVQQLEDLNVSNFPLDKCGPGEDVVFPSDPCYEYNADIDADEDAFKVEVADPVGNQEVPRSVRLQALEPTYDGGGKLQDHTEFGPKYIKQGRTLTTDLRQTDSGAWRSGYIRLIHRLASPSSYKTVTLRAGIKKVGVTPNKKVEILDQDISVAYTQPCCKAKKNKCTVQATIPLARGKRFGVGVRVLKTSKAKKGLVTKREVTKVIYESVRELFAQAQAGFAIKKHEVVDPPSDMLAIGDWDGKIFDPGVLHLPENGKPRKKTGNVKLEVSWLKDPVETKTTKPVRITQGLTPAQTAALIQTAIKDAFPTVDVEVSENPAQTNATGKSCDVILKPPTGRMIIKTVDGTDPDQPIHIIHIEVLDDRKMTQTDANQCVTVSNFPESYHICSPQMRCIFKSYTWAKDEEIKIALVSLTGLNSAGGPGLSAKAFGIGRLRDNAEAYRTSPAMQNCILAGADALSVGVLAHEFGHVLIDTGQHAISKDQLMYQTPDANTRSICGRLPPGPNWEFAPLGSDGKTRDLIRGQLRFNKIVMNAVARIHEKENAVGESTGAPLDVAFEPLKQETRKKLKEEMQAFFTKLLSSKAPTVNDITPGENYVPVRAAKLQAWYNYRTVFGPGADLRETAIQSIKSKIASAVKEAETLGSEPVKQAVRKATQKDDEGKFAALLLHTSERDFWDGFVQQCTSALSLVDGGGLPLMGFKGVIVKKPAVMLNIENFGQGGILEESGKRTQPGEDIHRHCYTVMHEFTHFHSYGETGFNHEDVVDLAPRGATGAWQTLLDEGATELFTRLLFYRSKENFTTEKPEICYLGLDGVYMPVYEVVKNVAVQMVQDVGLVALANAYFLGDFAGFFDALDVFEEGTARRYDEKFWRAFSKLAYATRPYLTEGSPECLAVDELRALRTAGLEPAPKCYILRPPDVIASWPDTYVDPAKDVVPLVV